MLDRHPAQCSVPGTLEAGLLRQHPSAFKKNKNGRHPWQGQVPARPASHTAAALGPDRHRYYITDSDRRLLLVYDLEIGRRW
jgi:hypothetical protein